MQDNQQTREFSEIIFMRKFNNFIKAILIDMYNEKLQKNCRQYKPSIFDLCSGKGGDLMKWLYKKPSHYVALEYQEQLSLIAKERLLAKSNVKFPSIFVVADAGDPTMTIDKVFQDDRLRDIKTPIVFDIVSCQFAMHYMFESEVKLRAFLHNVSCRLETGGFFIGTTIDADRVVSMIREKGGKNLTVGNKFYQIRFGQASFPKDQGPFGLKYYFYLKDAIGRERLLEDKKIHVPEYLVIFEYLEKLALEYNLKLIERKNFHEFYQESIQIPKNQQLFDKMVAKESGQKLTQDEVDMQFEISGLYQVFAFEKIGNQRRTTNRFFGNMKLYREINMRAFR
eukprot:403358695